MAEVLLESGADKNMKNRWGQTPLGEGIHNKQTACVELLQRWRATLNLDRSIGILCDAASRGDVITLRQLIDSNMDPRVGDYDGRTPLHLAAAEGHEKAVEYLIQHKANINAQDRWGERPIQDAIKAGHVLLASLIHSKGGLQMRAQEFVQDIHAHAYAFILDDMFGTYMIT